MVQISSILQGTVDLGKICYILGVICSVSYLISAIIMLVYMIQSFNAMYIVSMIIDIVCFVVIAALEAPNLVTVSWCQCIFSLTNAMQEPLIKCIFYFIISWFGFFGFGGGVWGFIISSICCWLLFFMYLFMVLGVLSGGSSSSSSTTTKTTTTKTNKK